MAGGLGVLSARAVSGLVERAMPPFVPGVAGGRRRFAVPGVVGATVAQLPVRSGESRWRAGVRTAGRLIAVSVVGGAINDAGRELRLRLADRRIRPIAAATALTMGLGIWAGRRLLDRTAAVDAWPVGQRSTLPASLATAAATTAVGMGMFRGYLSTRDRWIDYLGQTVPKQALARTINGGLWAAGLTAAYNAAVAYIGRANARSNRATPSRRCRLTSPAARRARHPSRTSDSRVAGT